jgi:hypothetical protein
MKRSIGGAILLALFMGAGLSAQTPQQDPSARLREVLPADVAERVLARIADARSRGLPAAALENRALKFASRGVNPDQIERAIADHSERMSSARQTIERARGGSASGDEVDAGAEAMRMGVDGAKVAALASSAPSGRSLAVPLLVVGSLVDRGLPSDQALQRVLERIQARATDADLERLPGDVAGKPAVTGRDMADTKRPDAATGRPGTAGPPAGVPGNAGAGARPTTGQMPGPTKKPAVPPPGRP